MSVFWFIFLYVWCREGGALSEIWVLCCQYFTSETAFWLQELRNIIENGDRDCRKRRKQEWQKQFLKQGNLQ